MKPMLTALLLLSFTSPAPAGPKKQAQPNQLTPKEIADGWVLLFDGETTFGWKVEGNAKAENGELVLSGTDKGPTVASTTTAFGNCEFQFEYRYHPQPRAYDGSVQFRGLALDFKSPKQGLGPWVDVKYTNAGDVAKYHFRVQGGDGGWTGPFIGGWKQLVSPLTISVGFRGRISVRNVKLRPVGFKSIFNGKDLTGWKEVPGRKSKVAATKEGWLNVKDGPGDLQTEGKWADFVLQLDCISNGKHLNSGVFFRCLPGEFWSGYEAQVRNQWEGGDRTKPVDFGTGGLYGRQPARKVVSSDKEWFTMTAVAQGKHIAIWVNGYQTVDFTDARKAAEDARRGAKTDAGPVSLQGHDPTTDLSFRNIRIAELPQAVK